MILSNDSDGMRIRGPASRTAGPVFDPVVGHASRSPWTTVHEKVSSLIDSLQQSDEADVECAWVDEVHTRARELETGQVRGLIWRFQSARGEVDCYGATVTVTMHTNVSATINGNAEGPRNNTVERFLSLLPAGLAGSVPADLLLKKRQLGADATLEPLAGVWGEVRAVELHELAITYARGGLSNRLDRDQ